MNWELGVLLGLSWLLAACERLWKTTKWHYHYQIRPKRRESCDKGKDESKKIFLVGIRWWGGVGRWVEWSKEETVSVHSRVFTVRAFLFCYFAWVLVLFCERGRHRAGDGKWFSATCCFHLLPRQRISSARREDFTTEPCSIGLLWFRREIFTALSVELFQLRLWPRGPLNSISMISKEFFRYWLQVTSLFLISSREQTPAGCITPMLVGVTLSFSFSSVSDEISCSLWGFESNQKTKIIVWDRCGWILGTAFVLTPWLSGSRTQRVSSFSNKKPLPQALVRNGHFNEGLVRKLVYITELRPFHLLPMVESFFFR